MIAEAEPLACPRCATRYSLEERFCANCGMPLTYAGEVDVEQPAGELAQHARKIKPQYARGPVRQVAIAQQQPEAEFIQMLLLEEGIPSILRRSTWDVPEMLPAGPRSVMVPESGVAKALEVLRSSELEAAVEHDRARAAAPSPVALLGGVVAAAGVVAILIVIGRALG
jgi:hypothetical protein